jgi:hypothetical protein
MCVAQIYTKCVAKIVIDSELNGDCLYGAVIQSNDTMSKWIKPFEEKIPERAKEKISILQTMVRMAIVNTIETLQETKCRP